MKQLLFIVSLMASVPASAAETPVPLQSAPQAWLGLEVSKPDASITAHLPALPPGIGFVVRSIDKNGPAATAGLREFDIIWKIGDQMLVNEGQLAALLRLSKPGDEVGLSGFRGGKPMEVTIKLGQVPPSKMTFPGEMLEAAILPGGCGGPMRVVNVQEKTASYSTADGRVEVRREGTVHHVKILGSKDELLYDGQLPPDGNLEGIPEGWRGRVGALRRGLDQALDGRIMPLRQPRPRVVPPPSPKP